MTESTPDISVIVPVFRSQSTLQELAGRIVQCLEEERMSFEIILSDDCSPDGSWELAKELSREDSRLRAIRLARNSGQMAATLAGIHRSRGRFIVTLDDDLQYPPEEISVLIRAIKGSGKSMIFGAPAERRHNLSHNLMARIVMFVFDYILLPSYRRINFYTTFRIMKRDLFFGPEGKVNLRRNLFFFWEIPAEEMAHVEVKHHFRRAGRSNQTLSSLLKHYLPQISLGIKVFSGIMAVLFLLAGLIIAILQWKVDPAIPSWTYRLAFVLSLFFFLFNTLGNRMLEKSRVISYELQS